MRTPDSDEPAHRPGYRSDACTREVPCIEAEDVGTLTVFHFDERAAADFYGANASGVTVEGNFVVVLGPDATDADRERLEGELD